MEYISKLIPKNSLKLLLSQIQKRSELTFLNTSYSNPNPNFKYFSNSNKIK